MWVHHLARKNNLFSGLTFNVLANVLLKRWIVHPSVRLMLQQVSLMEIKAVIAIDIALRAGRFVHRVEAIVPASGKRRKFEFRFLHRPYLLVDFGDFITLNTNAGH